MRAELILPARRCKRFLPWLLLTAGCAHLASLAPLATSQGSARQWAPDRRLTSSHAIAQLSYHYTKSIAADRAGGVHVVWYDTRDGDPHIYYKRSMDHGVTWGPDRRLSEDPAPKEQPAIAVAGAAVYVVWHDLRNGSMDVYFIRSLDRGRTWGPARRLSHANSDSMYPSIAVSGSHLHVTFADNRDGPIHVYYLRSDDRGVTWSPELRLSDSLYDAWTPSVAASDTSVYAVWVDTRDGNEEEYLRRSLDNGRTWEPAVRLTNDLANSWAPVIAVSGQTVHVAWFTQKNSRIQPRDAEHKLDEILALLRLPVTAEPSGVVITTPPRNAKQRIEVKLQKIHAAAPAWQAQGGDVTKLRALLRAFEQMAKPTPPVAAETQLDTAMQLVGLPVQPAPQGAGASPDVAAWQARVRQKIQEIETAVPGWVARSGDVKQLRAKLNAFSRLANVPRPSLEDREQKLDEALQLLGVPFVPAAETARVYYLDAMQERIQAKLQQVRAAAPDWVRGGGDPHQLEAILQEVKELIGAGASQWAICYQRSTDGGRTWEAPISLTEASGSARRPSLEVVGQAVHLVWMDMRDGGEGIYYKHSPDGGLSWGPETYLVQLKSDWGVHPSIAASGPFTHLVWVDQRDGNPEVYYKRKVHRLWSWNYGE